MPPTEPVTLTVDRVDGDRAVLTDETRQVEVPASWLPPGAVEGSALRLGLAPDAQRELAERVEALQSRRRSGEDIDL